MMAATAAGCNSWEGSGLRHEPIARIKVLVRDQELSEEFIGFAAQIGCISVS